MFNVEKETADIVAFIQEYYNKNNLGGCVLGISGGKDSAVVAALMCKALGAENVVGVTLPCHSKDQDRSDALLVSNHFGFEMLHLDLSEMFDAFTRQIATLGSFTEEETKNSDINMKPRLRMASVYYLAALLSATRHKTYLVAGTSNKCELYVGYFTKGGDSVYDIAPIADYTVAEVIQIGEYLGVPDTVIHKAPHDGLSKQTDEEKLGVTYREIAQYMENSSDLPTDTAHKIERLHRASRHKFGLNQYHREQK